MESKSLERMKELTVILKNASRAYYQEASEIMSNYEYDALYDELVELEKETGVILAGSPTQTVGYEVQSELPKRTHPSPMLSLDKTKEREALAQWLGDREGVMSWKMDGLTVVLTYENGELTDAVTRGNGEVGEVITANAKTFVNVPLRIPFEGRLVLRGEAVIGYRDFEAINRTIADADARYKNPRNLCSGSVRQLDSKITAQRNVRFFAFALIEAQDRSFPMIADQFGWLKELGFETVEYIVVPEGGKVPATVQLFADKIADMEYPSDGLVLCYNDIAVASCYFRKICVYS